MKNINQTFQVGDYVMYRSLASEDWYGRIQVVNHYAPGQYRVFWLDRGTIGFIYYYDLIKISKKEYFKHVLAGQVKNV